ncbi:host cell division inhibitor Icd-like protein [Enterobacter sp. PTB]|uniref:host cell division inhibitor Icd-like protein n=1 Tax=Enterobacter sp. PTB TaxID=3143437 RepID=UPI003DA9462B
MYMISIPAISSFSNPVPHQSQRPLAERSYMWLFLAVRRSDMKNKPHSIRINATTYHEARKKVSASYVACFAGRIPVMS